MRVPSATLVLLFCLWIGVLRRALSRSELDLLLLLPYAEKYASEGWMLVAVVLELALKFGESLTGEKHRFSLILESFALVGLFVLGVLGLLYILKRFRSVILRRNFLRLLRIVHRNGQMKGFVLSIDGQRLAKWLEEHCPDYNLNALIDYVKQEYDSVPIHS